MSYSYSYIATSPPKNCSTCYWLRAGQCQNPTRPPLVSLEFDDEGNCPLWLEAPDDE